MYRYLEPAVSTKKAGVVRRAAKSAELSWGR